MGRLKAVFKDPKARARKTPRSEQMPRYISPAPVVTTLTGSWWSQNMYWFLPTMLVVLLLMILVPVFICYRDTKECARRDIEQGYGRQHRRYRKRYRSTPMRRRPKKRLRRWSVLGPRKKLSVASYNSSNAEHPV